jgi:putative tryptophan/tyrosine transport system substrate-binding protein
MRDMRDIERTIETFAARPNGGLIVTTSACAQIHRSELVALAARHRLPAMYPYRLFTTMAACAVTRQTSSISTGKQSARLTV